MRLKGVEKVYQIKIFAYTKTRSFFSTKIRVRTKVPAMTKIEFFFTPFCLTLACFAFCYLIRVNMINLSENCVWIKNCLCPFPCSSFEYVSWNLCCSYLNIFSFHFISMFYLCFILFYFMKERNCWGAKTRVWIAFVGENKWNVSECASINYSQLSGDVIAPCLEINSIHSNQFAWIVYIFLRQTR